MNGVIIQFFHWYHPGKLWKEFTQKAEHLKELGFTAVWFPPAVKCDLGLEGRGYDVYDMYDLGEFYQKNTVPTRYGTKAEYIEAIEKAHALGLHVYADMVLNHRMGADEREKVTVQEVHEENRTEIISQPFETEAYTKFTFPGRNGAYSNFTWDYQCFSGVDRIFNGDSHTDGIFKIHNQYGMDWNSAASHQFGNYDYLMGADVEFRNPYVVEELKKWVKWYIETTKVDGLRLDALKHISSDFIQDWVNYIKSDLDGDFFFVGEYWTDQLEEIANYSERIDHAISLFDIPLHFNFFVASREKQAYDLRKILDHTFFKLNPAEAVSFVGNHDTQKLQSLESPVENWFRPLAYAIILLSENAYPCVFYPDLYGAEYADKGDNGEDIMVIMRKVELLPRLLEARQKFAYGKQLSYFDHHHCIAWRRIGNSDNSGCLVMISNGEEACKEIDFGKEYAGKIYIDFLQTRFDEVILDENGKGRFWVNPASVSVWIQK